MKHSELLLNMVLWYYCCVSVSALAISDVGGLIVGTRSEEWAQTYCQGMEHEELERTHALFSAVGSKLRASTDEFGSRASVAPFLVRCGDSAKPLVTFGTEELGKAIESDFLDAGEGSTNANKGWRMNPVGQADRGNKHSFTDARVSFSDVENAKGTVIFNSAGAHISSTLAAASLAALDGLDGQFAGVCLNMYVTRGDAKVSAPPHTDKQDVVVVQTQGRKHWKVYSPPDNKVKPTADPFCRGKGADDLPVQTLEESGSKLLFEATLNPGDLLFVPSRFPHTTDTLSCYKDDPEKEFGVQNWSIHLTIGLDSHVWSMNYLSMRRMGLLKFGMLDVLAEDGAAVDDDSCVGAVNNLSEEVREQLFSPVDGDLICGDDTSTDPLEVPVVEVKVARELYVLNKRVNAEVGNEDTTLSLEQCVEIVTKFCAIGRKILNTHKEMYISAMYEENTRRAGEGWRADENMTKQQSDRLSIFRVPAFFEKLDDSRNELRAWVTDGNCNDEELPLILNGDQIEADLEGSMDRCAWSPAKVVRVRTDGHFDIQLFDGKVKRGVRREAIKGPHGIGIFL
jgi:hypothetical protein